MHIFHLCDIQKLIKFNFETKRNVEMTNVRISDRIVEATPVVVRLQLVTTNVYERSITRIQ